MYACVYVFLLFYKAPRKTRTKNTKEKEIKLNASSFTLFKTIHFLPNQRWNLENFFKHENHPYPPSISTYEDIRPSVKPDLLQCLKKYYNASEKCDSILLDGPVIVDFLDPKCRY